MSAAAAPMAPRDYQQHAVDMTYDWLRNHDGNPCIVMPTGSGKSLVIAELCRDALQSWPGTRILMLTHQRELIAQNAAKLRAMWPNAPLGIYSAGLGKRQLYEPITYASIQSVRTRADLIGHVDLILIDECFVAGTKISTPTGPKDIDLVRCGDTVYNAHGVGSVLAVSAKPSQDIYKLEFSDGTFIECTGNHPFFTEQGWTQARELENGTYFFSIEGLRLLWSSVSSLDQKRQEYKQDHFGLSRADLDQARLLLNILCEEIEKPNEQSSGSLENESEAEGDKAQAYQAWRQRAVAAFGTACLAARLGGRVGGRIGGTYQDEEYWSRLSDLLQIGLGKSVNEAGNRAGRRKSLQPGKKGSGLEENGFSCFPRLERISRIQSAGARTVFNIQVSGHPSYFANGKLVHNCHLVSHHAEGSYRTLLEALSGINPALRVIGLTATPYRLGHGLITDDQAIFDALLEPVGIAELVERGYLSVLRSKHTQATLSADGVRRRGGEYVERELQAAVDTESNNAAVVREIIERGQERSTWLIFCAGVQHARNIATLLADNGIPTGCVTGDMPNCERDQTLADYAAGRLRALTNANVLTVGYDHPRIDLIAMLRPTLSPGLYVQMAGRGLRIAPGKADCLVLDFACNIARHGPITDVAPPRRRRPGDAETAAPTKTCEVCGEIVHASVRVCPACAVAFPVREREPLTLDRSADIMGLEPREMRLSAWSWSPYVSRTSGNEMLRVCYYGEALSDPVVSEYLPLLNFGYAGDRAIRTLAQMARDAYVPMPTRQQAETNDSDWLHSVADAMSSAPPPERLIYRRDGRFYRVISRHWASLLSAPQPITEDHSVDDIPF